MSNVAINIAAEFTGKKAFKQAETSTDKLNKSVKKLAGGLLLAFGTKQILAFGKASVKAFAEDDKAARALGQTLKNLGLAYGSNASTVNGFISRLELQTGVLDDELRPAMDRLLRATGDVTKSQELLGLALDISAGTGKSLTQVSQSLQKAYLGQTQALGRLGVGLSRAELTSSSFEEIQARLSTLFAGQATAAADTYAGSLAKLTVAGNNAKETIGKGLVDAFVTASNSSSIDDLIGKIDRAAEAMAGFLRETGKFISITKDIFKNPSFFAPSGGLFGDGKGFGNISMTVSSQDTQRADAIAKKNATAMAKLTGVQAANQAKILKDKRLATAIDKANLALNKGSEVFDMDKIQIAAALTSQAEQLGKATTASQVLQIANDTARLNVKQSILALEDAIAAKDEAAITAATKKLNEDLKVLGVLGQQNVKLMDIKSILDTLLPKDLINLQNLKDAIALLGQIKIPSMTASVAPSGASVAKALESFKGTAASAFESLTAAQQATLGGYEPFVGAKIPTTVTDSGGSGVGLGSNGTGRQVPAGVNITVNTGIGDPNAIAEAIDQVLTDAATRGTLRGYTIA
jgi:hypothetical protein